MNILQIAKYILGKYPGKITPMKLQKLTYYTKVWSLVATQKDLVRGNFYAWKYGPVNKSLYKNYKKYGGDVIKQVPSGEQYIVHKDIVDFILASYSPYSAYTLSQTTHSEDPWKNNSESGLKISKNEMQAYYSKKSFAKNFPLSADKPYYPPETSGYYSFIFDFSDDEAAEITFDSIEDYVDKMESAQQQVLNHFN